MNRFATGSRRALLASCVTLAAAALFAQDRPAADAQAADAQTADVPVAEVPRLPNGKPDFSGFWSMATVTPTERPAALGDKAFYTEAEFAEFQAQAIAYDKPDPGTEEDVHYGFVDYGLHPSQNTLATNLRTSIIYDPPNGRIPALLPEAQARWDARQAHARAHALDSAKERMLQERCIVWPHNGPPMLPTGYNNNAKVVQTDGHFVFQQEMMQDPRIIPLDGRAAIPENLPQWYGSPRGQWEGDTIVVETTNFTGITGRTIPSISTRGKVSERFTMVGPDTMLYQFTVTDPDSWPVPWSGEFHLQRTTGPMFEYACHEGNYGIVDVLSSARAAEQAGESP